MYRRSSSECSVGYFTASLSALPDSWLSVHVICPCLFRLTHYWTSVSLPMASCRSGRAQTVQMTKCQQSHRPPRGPGRPNPPVCCYSRSESQFHQSRKHNRMFVLRAVWISSILRKCLDFTSVLGINKQGCVWMCWYSYVVYSLKTIIN